MLFRARLPGIVLPSPGEILRLRFDAAHTLFFPAEGDISP